MLGVKKVSVRIDTGLKGEFERALDGIGLDSTNAMRCFAGAFAYCAPVPRDFSEVLGHRNSER